MYDFKLNFETARTTESGKVSVNRTLTVLLLPTNRFYERH